MSIPIVEWQGCYSTMWKGLLANASYSHPAKFSPGLIERILRHGVERGWWQRGGAKSVTAEIQEEIAEAIKRRDYVALCRPPINCQTEALPSESIEGTRPARGSRSAVNGSPAPSMCGAPSLAQSPEDSSSTTSTATPPTIESTTSPSLFELPIRNSIAINSPSPRAAAKPRRSRSSAQSAEAATPANISGKTLSVMDAGPRSDGRQSYVTSSGYVLHGSDGPGVPSIGDTIEIQPSRIGDPFGGVATGGVIAQSMGLAWVGLELEEKFVEIGRRNIDLSAHRCESLGLPVAVLLQGDSRAFCETVAGVVTSPPYGSGADTQHPDGRKRAMQGVGERYGATAGQIGSLRTGVVDGIVSSPPYCDSRIGKTGPGSVQEENLRRPSFREECYGGEAAQIGNLAAGKVETAMRGPLTGHCACGSVLGRESGETYWAAMAKVYASCFQAIRPGGFMACVVKDYVKRRKRVTLCDDTLRLLEHVGFVAVERIHAMLVETKTEDGLFGAIETTKERKSFFRRVQEQKGAERIDWEEVLIVRKP